MSAIVVLTGATSGLGREIARQLDRRGDRLIAVGRDPRRAAALSRDLGGGRAGTGDLRHVVVTGDLATAAGRRAFAETVLAESDHVDTLINNAGVMTPTRQESRDGHELNFAVHHLAPFGLTSLLMPVLRAGQMPDGPAGSRRARVVNVNSAGHQSSLGGHHNPQLDFDDLQSSATGYDPFLTYSRSKLANLLFSYELARRHGDDVVVSAIHPGMVRTDLGRLFPRIRAAALQAFATSVGKAAPPVIALATGPVPTEGGYYDQGTLTRSSPPSYDTRAAARLWAVTEQILGPFDPSPPA